MLEGFVGEKFFIMVRNPYQIDFGFYVSATSSSIIVHNVPFQQSEKTPMKIAFNSSIKLSLEIIDSIGRSRDEFILVSDLENHVVGVYKLIIFGNKVSKMESYRGSYRGSARGMQNLADAVFKLANNQTF